MKLFNISPCLKGNVSGLRRPSGIFLSVGLLACGLTASQGSAQSSHAAAAPRYAVTDLGPALTSIGWGDSGKAINNRGEVVGSFFPREAGPASCAFLWRDTNHDGQATPEEFQVLSRTDPYPSETYYLNHS